MNRSSSTSVPVYAVVSHSARALGRERDQRTQELVEGIWIEAGLEHEQDLRKFELAVATVDSTGIKPASGGGVSSRWSAR